jgi:tripartite-type tricarboxylate transporter receptor subunit TctC
MVADLIGGHIDMAFVALPVVMKQISSKTMTGIAVAAKNEVPQLPGAPTVAATYPGFTSLSWVGFVAPAKTPEDIVARLNKEVVATLREPEVKANLEKLGYFIEASSPKEFAELIRTQSERLGPIIKAQEAASR